MRRPLRRLGRLRVHLHLPGFPKACSVGGIANCTDMREAQAHGRSANRAGDARPRSTGVLSRSSRELDSIFAVPEFKAESIEVVRRAGVRFLPFGEVRP